VETSPTPTGNRYEIEYELTPAIARRTFWAVLWRERAAYVLVTPLLFLWCLAESRSHTYGFLAGLGMGVVLLTWSSWWASLRTTRRLAATWSDAKVRIVLTEEGCTFESLHRQTELAWPAVVRIERLPDLWLFRFQGMPSPSPVPTAALPPAAQDFIVRRVTEAGGRVR
jgi:hypothetical protein